MKRFGKYYLVIFFIINLIMFLLALIVYRNQNVRLPFIRIEFGALLISTILASAVYVFKLEKGNSLINVVLGYLIIIPAIIIMRVIYGTYLFKSASLIYIIMVIVGIIYGIVVLIVSKKYKQEVDNLNKLLAEKEEKEEK